MIKAICNYLNECFCKHEYCLIKEIENYMYSFHTMPSGYTNVYMCNKCGSVKKVKM